MWSTPYCTECLCGIQGLVESRLNLTDEWKTAILPWASMHNRIIFQKTIPRDQKKQNPQLLSNFVSGEKNAIEIKNYIKPVKNIK